LTRAGAGRLQAGTAADAYRLGRGGADAPARSAAVCLHCGQVEREDQMAWGRVASFAQYGCPFPGFADDFTRL